MAWPVSGGSNYLTKDILSEYQFTLRSESCRSHGNLSIKLSGASVSYYPTSRAAALRQSFRNRHSPLMADWSLWPPLEGEGTGVDRWPLRKFPLVDSERNIVETSIIIEVPAARAFRASASADAEIRTSPDFGFIRVRLPTPTSTPVRGCAAIPNTHGCCSCPLQAATCLEGEIQRRRDGDRCAERS